MHWLIPSVSHTVLTLLAWLWGTVTPLAAVLSFALPASHYLHPWAAFYGLFAIVFTVGTCHTAILQYLGRRSSTQQSKQVKWTRNVVYLACNLFLVALLVPAHLVFLKHRLQTAPWWHTRRSPYGCLPIPSRTLTLPIRYGWLDAIGNQLPYGIVASYAIAVACTLGTGLRDHINAVGLKPAGVIAGVAGAAVVALVAAEGLPLCGEDPVDGKHEVAMHIDRSVEWKERTPMAWSANARYVKFVILIAAAASYAGVLAAQIASVARRRKLKSLAAKQASKRQDVKEKVPTDQTQRKQPNVGVQFERLDDIDNDYSSYQWASLAANFLVTSGVVFGMAVWSYTGPRAEQTQSIMDYSL